MLKRCPRCGKTKDTGEFYRSAYTISGFYVYCKKCSGQRHNDWRRRHLPQMRKASKKWRDEHPRAAKDYSLQSRYGLPLGGYDALLAKQNGRCAICGTDKPNGRGDFHIDHDSTTKIIRGLLCHHCNLGIGNFYHDPDRLATAIRYLTQPPVSSKR
jgi:hypothetical protein